MQSSIIAAGVLSAFKRRKPTVAMPAEEPSPGAFGLTDADLAYAHISMIVLLLVGGLLMGMPATTTKKLAEFDAAQPGRKASKHPAWWWPAVDLWCRSVEWANRTLLYGIGPPLIKVG